MDKVEALRKLLHPAWVAAWKAAVRTEGREGWSQAFDCLRVCPGCGAELCMYRRGAFWQDMDGVVYFSDVDAEELFCRECDNDAEEPSPQVRALEDLHKETGDDDLDLTELNRYRVVMWLHPHWRPNQELTEACLLGNPLALLFFELAGEVLDADGG
jgi:hypothetical protein